MTRSEFVPEGTDDRLASAAVVFSAYRKILVPFNEMQVGTIDLDSGTRLDIPVGDPEFGYQILGIMNSLLGALAPLLCPDLVPSP